MVLKVILMVVLKISLMVGLKAILIVVLNISQMVVWKILLIVVSKGHPDFQIFVFIVFVACARAHDVTTGALELVVLVSTGSWNACQTDRERIHMGVLTLTPLPL